MRQLYERILRLDMCKMEIAHIKWQNDLIEGCRQNNRHMQKKLYEHYHGTMLGICMRYGRNRDEALEIVNNGFLKVFQKIGDYKPQGSFEGWIKRIMVNCGIDHYRKNQGAVRKIDEVFPDFEYDAVSHDNVIDRMSSDEIVQLVQKLPESYKIVFNLFVIEGYGHKEIAEKLKISEGTSKSSLSKARKKLQVMVKEHFENRRQYV